MDTTESLAAILDVPLAQLAWHVVALPSWDALRKCGSVRVTVIARTRRGLRAHAVEAATEGDALAHVVAKGLR